MGRINRFIQRCKLKIDFGRKVDSLLNRCQHLHSPSSPAIQDYLHCSDSHSAHLTALLCTSLLLNTFYFSTVEFLLCAFSFPLFLILFPFSSSHCTTLDFSDLASDFSARSEIQSFCRHFSCNPCVDQLSTSLIGKILAKHVYFMHLFLSRKEIEERTIPTCLHHGRC